MTILRRYKVLLGRKRDVCAHVLCARIHSLLYQLKIREVIRQRFNLLDVPNDLKAIFSNEILISVPMGVLNVGLFAAE